MRLLPLAAALLAAGPAFAQASGSSTPPTAQPDVDFSKDRVTVAVGAATVPDYIGSNHNRIVPAPAAIGSIKGFNFALIGNQFSADLVREAPGSKVDFQLGPVASINFNRKSLSSIHDPRVKALGKIGIAPELGGYVGIGKTGIITSPYDKLSLSVSYRHDVTGVYGGAVVTPSINYLTPLSRKIAVGAFASADHASGGYARRYFGITPAQSLASGLARFNPSAGWEDYTVGGLATISITGNLLHGFGIVVGGTYSRLMNDFAASPVTSVAGSRNQLIGAAGVAYTF